jgi:hypothetical protein
MQRFIEPIYKKRPGGFDIRPAAPGEAQRINEFLAEVVLQTDPVHAGVLGASLNADRQLVEESANFWQIQWLRHKISELENALGVAGE